MVDSIARIRQLLAESKFVEAQKESEVYLSQNESAESSEIIELYFHALDAQSRPLPQNLLEVLIDSHLPLRPDQAELWLKRITSSSYELSNRSWTTRIQIAELKGRTEEMYNLVSGFQQHLYRLRIPHLPQKVEEIISKYFQNNYQIKLQKLALDLMRQDLSTGEKEIKELILSCIERSSQRGIKEKINGLLEILKSSEGLNYLEVYKNLCSFMVYGITDEKEYKKVVELIIYVDDFRMQTILLNLLYQFGLTEVVEEYAKDVKQHPDYTYVYFDKFLPHLKQFFFQKPKVEKIEDRIVFDEVEQRDTKNKFTHPSEQIADLSSDEELVLVQTIKHQSFTPNELLELAVSFLQSELPLAGLKAAQSAYLAAPNDIMKLKASYLKVTCLFKLGDFRAALDVSHEALSISQTQNDILSFLYSQAEAHIRLKNSDEAKSILERILSIDSDYRLTRERLDRLNEV